MMDHLITADQAFPAMEELVLGAIDTLDASLHVFSPRTRTRNAAAHERRLFNWGDLIADAARRGVAIRILLNDFDPVGAPDMHASVWERVGLLGGAFDDLSEPERANLRLLVAHPGGQSGAVLRTVVWPKVRALAHAAIKDWTERGRSLPPGLAELKSNGHVRWWPPAPNFTQTLHQKFLIADGKRAVLGGLDIDERRYDDPAHRRDAEQTWHDVCVAFDGAAVGDLSAHFDACWRAVRRDGTSHAAAFVRANPGFSAPLETTDRAIERPGLLEPAKINGVRVATTRPVPGNNPFRFGPRPRTQLLEQQHIEAIGSARRLLYIETQFFRASSIRDALMTTLHEREKLHVIMLLPGAPDDVAYSGRKDGAHRYGEWLQMRALNRLTSSFPARFGAFCLTNDIDRDEQHERDALHGKGMVYVHSKLLVADDRRAIVSSANLNGRSLQWDIEAGISVDDAGFAGRLRADLWSAHLGEIAATLDPSSDPGEALAAWREQAEARRKAGRSATGTGIVPFPLEETRRFSKRHVLLPEELV